MKHLILVEDEIEFQIHISEALKGDDDWLINNFTNGKSAVKFFKQLTTPPSIAVVDLGLPDISGLKVVEELHDTWPNVPILIFTAFSSASSLKDGLSKGACGYIVKDDDSLMITKAIYGSLVGHTPISPKVVGHLAALVNQKMCKRRRKPSLSIQEQRLLELISAGKSYAVAAHIMGLKLSTVHSYSRNLFKKLDANSKTQALVRAREFGLT